MVLGTGSAQYKFLQVLGRTYAYMIANLQSGNCITNPEIFTDCTNYNGILYNMPYLPVANDLVGANNPEQFYYGDFNVISWYGFNSSNFPTAKFITASTAALYAACAANATCTASYSATANADSVVSSLATTNVNTVSRLLTANPKKTYYPSSNFGWFASMHIDLPTGQDETYGVHAGVIQSIIARTVNASTYISQYNLGNMLDGGFQVYEAMVHVGAVGSWSASNDAQSNINLTAPQYFTKVASGGSGLDTRRSLSSEEEPNQYRTKWDVWNAKSHGIHISNETQVFDEIKRRVRESQPYSDPPSGYHYAARRRNQARAACTPPNNQQGLAWLKQISQSCTNANFLNGFKSVSGPLASALAGKTAGLLTSTQYNAVQHTYAGVLSGQVISLCANGKLGYPCYPGANVWQIKSGVPSIVGVLADVALYSNPVGPVIGTVNLFCGAAGIALAAYQHDAACCSLACNTPTCQSSINGATQGTGLC